MLITVLFPFCPHTLDGVWSHSALMASSPYTSRLTCWGSEKRVTCQRHRCPSLLEQEGDGQSWPAVLQRNVKHFSRWASLSCKCRSDVLPLFQRHIALGIKPHGHTAVYVWIYHILNEQNTIIYVTCENVVTEVWRLSTDSNILMDRLDRWANHTSKRLTLWILSHVVFPRVHF